MGFLVFVVVAAIVVGGPLLWMSTRTKRRRGQLDMVLIWHSNSEPDKTLTVGALRSAGIYSHVIESGGSYRAGFGTMGMPGGQWEIWVPARDEARGARGSGDLGSVFLNRTFTLVKMVFTGLLTVTGETVPMTRDAAPAARSLRPRRAGRKGI